MRDPLIGLLRWAQKRRNGWLYILASFALVQLVGVGLVALDLVMVGYAVFLLGALLSIALFREVFKR